MAALSNLQRMVADSYADGSFAYVTDTQQAEECGDTLFTFCIHEAHDAETKEELVAMLQGAISDLQSLIEDIEADTKEST